MRCSASLGLSTVCVMVKYSDCDIRSTALCVCKSICDVTTTVRTFFTSVVMAKPNISIITTGIPKSMSIVRLSRRICRVSFITNDLNCFIIVNLPSLPPLRDR